MTTTPPQDRQHDAEDILAESAAAQEEAASVLRQVAARLDKLSTEMRKHGAFPIAGQIERERKRLEGKASAISNGS